MRATLPAKDIKKTKIIDDVDARNREDNEKEPMTFLIILILLLITRQ